MLLFATLLACKDDPAPPGPAAIFEPSRPEHFFDLPFPSDELLDGDQLADLAGYPTALNTLTASLVDGWVTRLEQTANGFGNNSAAYFRFEGPLELPKQTAGDPSDPVLLIDTATGELLPLELLFVQDPLGDPFWGDNTLALAPLLGHPPASGATLAAVVMRSAGASPPKGYELPAAAADALVLAGVDGEAAVATVFTVQDATGQLQQLEDDVEARISGLDWEGVQLLRVTNIEYSQGTTPSGKDATVFVATFEDDTTETTYLAALNEEEGNHAIDLLDDWPMAVYQAYVPVWNYSGLDDVPYMSPGMGTITDVNRSSGWIDFLGGQLVAEPDLDATRVTISIPLGDDGLPIDDADLLIYDHGTGGHAYNVVQRRNVNDQGLTHAELYAAAGVATIGRDAPLYGTRYPLIDEGYGSSLGFYNVVNLPAFRDNQRQAALEGFQVRLFAETALNDLLPAGSIDPSHPRRMGHSLGSVTTNLGTAMDPTYDGVFLSGTGGVFSHYFLDTGLLAGMDPELIGSLFDLFGATQPDEITTPAILGAALGVPEEAWANIGRLHPAMTLFQWTMDPSDPMAVARDETVPALVFVGIGDWQVPNFTSYALAEALPEPSVVECTPTWEYDPHYCLHRESEGFDALEAWLAE